MESREAMERFEKAEELSESRERFGRHAAILVAIVAAFLAIAALAATQSVEETILSQARATDAYNELEANSVKKHIDEGAASALEILSKGTPNEAAAQAKAAALIKKVKVKYEPREEALLERARDFERERDRSQAHHRGFQLAEAILQLGIVLLSIAIVARARWLLGVGLAMGIFGLAFLVDGFTLVVPLPR